MSHPVVVVDYDPEWPTLYEKERRRIVDAIGHRALAVEHIGSTAVPGLGAKPIIDIMACVPERSDADDCIPLLRQIGYTDITPEEGNADWFYCLGKSLHTVVYHLHLMRYGSEFSKKHLIFRDYLRTHPDVAREYYELKKRLASKYRSDRTVYTESKTSFIEAVVAKARH